MPDKTAAMGLTPPLWQAIFDGLGHGVFVFDAAGVLLVVNKTAVSLAGNDLAAGKKIYDYLCRGPLEHALSLITLRAEQKEDREILFLCGLKNDFSIHRCRLLLLDGGVLMVLYMDAQARGDTSMDRIRQKVEGLRSPLANLRAAVENLNAVDEMPQVLASAFENIITEETLALSGGFAALAEDARREQQRRRGIFPVRASEFILALKRLFAEKKIAAPVTSRTKRSLLTDSYGLLVLVAFFAGKIAARFQGLEILLREKGGDTLYLDCIWQGEIIGSDLLSRWLRENLPDSCGMPMQVQSLVEQLAITVWSQSGENEGESLLRMPVKTSVTAEHAHAGVQGSAG